jgi:hypothetical protein
MAYFSLDKVAFSKDESEREAPSAWIVCASADGSMMGGGMFGWDSSCVGCAALTYLV